MRAPLRTPRATGRASVVALAAVALLAGGCGTNDEAPAAQMTTATQELPSPAATRIPEVPPADPPSVGAAPGAAREAQPAVAAPELPEQVQVHRPAALVRSQPKSFAKVRAARKVEGVAALSGASSFEIELRSPQGGAERLTAAAVDPEGFRPLTPEVTAQTVGVWERMTEGEIVLRHDVANRLGVALGDTVTVAGPGATEEVRVGAFASNGAPPVADLLVPWDLGRRLGAPDVNLLVVAVREDADAGDVTDGIVDVLGGGKVELRDAPEQHQAQVVGGSYDFEPFTYTELGDGMIVIDPAWVQKWIVRVDLPRVGSTRVHRVMAPQLLAAFDEIRAEGLLDHFKPEQFGGAWVPRHIDWSPAKPLSMHAWGLAIDLNTHDNWLGEQPQMDPRVVEIFEKWGFAWGGRWTRPDGMHFELARVVRVAG